MSTLVSIILYGLSIFSASMMGFGASQSRNKPLDRDAESSVSVAGVAAIIFFVLAVALQVTKG